MIALMRFEEATAAANLVFYEKPGCASNAKQKQILREAGVTFETRSLLAEPWTTDRLELFFRGLPVAQWFNRAAPRVKSGEVDPDRISAAQALALMVADPLLIRRPLLEKGQWRSVGFDWPLLSQTLHISASAENAPSDLESCRHAGTEREHTGCATPHEVAR